MKKTSSTKIIGATADGIVTFAGAAGKPVEWSLSAIRDAAEAAEDAEIRAAWDDLLVRGRRAVADAVAADREQERERRMAPVYLLVARLGIESDTKIVTRAAAEYMRDRTETTFEALVRTVADSLSTSDVDARGLVMAAAEVA